jgi:uncharacterized protein YceK
VVRSLAGVLAAAVLLEGCGAATTHKDAEEAASIAAEGALLAHDAAEGATTSTFTRTTARIRTRDVVPWSAVVRANRGGIVVRDGTEPR